MVYRFLDLMTFYNEHGRIIYCIRAFSENKEKDKEEEEDEDVVEYRPQQEITTKEHINNPTNALNCTNF